MKRLKKFIPRSSRSFCAWMPDPKGGIQLLKAGRFQWWVFDGEKDVGYLDALTKDAGGGWRINGWTFCVRGLRAPRRTKLDDAARLAAKLAQKGFGR